MAKEEAEGKGEVTTKVDRCHGGEIGVAHRY